MVQFLSLKQFKKLGAAVSIVSSTRCAVTGSPCVIFTVVIGMELLTDKIVGLSIVVSIAISVNFSVTFSAVLLVVVSDLFSVVLSVVLSHVLTVELLVAILVAFSVMISIVKSIAICVRVCPLDNLRDGDVSVVPDDGGGVGVVQKPIVRRLS